MNNSLTKIKEQNIAFMNNIASERDNWILRNAYYYRDIAKFFKHNILNSFSVLEIGCGTGRLLNEIKPFKGTGIDISEKMIEIAKNRYRNFNFLVMDVENLRLNDQFDYIIISDTLCYLFDVQKAFSELRKVSTPSSKIIITYHNYLWVPLLNIAEVLGFKMHSPKLNWLSYDDTAALLSLEGFDIIKKGRRCIFPKYLPIISWFLNKYISYLPLFDKLCITSYIIAKKRPADSLNNTSYTVSVVIPARNEKGNIEKAVKRIPKMGKHTEIIFIEGHSSDNTLEEIKRICIKYANKLDLKFAVQDGMGKGDAVRKGFEMAKGDILMILDADLTMPPEELPKFYRAIANGDGEFINGSRLVYPMEEEAMRILNIIGNKFFSIMFSWLLGTRLKDTLCGTKVLFKRDYEKIIANRKYFGEFDPFGDFDLLFGAAKLNLDIVEIPIRYQARKYGSTNISRFKHGLLLLKMVFFAMWKIKFI